MIVNSAQRIVSQITALSRLKKEWLGQIKFEELLHSPRSNLNHCRDWISLKFLRRKNTLICTKWPIGAEVILFFDFVSDLIFSNDDDDNST